MEIRKPHENPDWDHLIRVRDYDTRDPKKPRVANEPPEWHYWNRMPNVSLDEAICLTLNFDPRSYLSKDSHSWRYNELRDFAKSSILDGSLQFQNKFTREKFRAVDWLQWLKRIDKTAPKEWRPIDLAAERDEEPTVKGGPRYEEAVAAAIIMCDDPSVPIPPTLDDLYRFMIDHNERFPVNCGTNLSVDIESIERQVRRDAKKHDLDNKNPLKDLRFLERKTEAGRM